MLRAVLKYFSFYGFEICFELICILALIIIHKEINQAPSVGIFINSEIGLADIYYIFKARHIFFDNKVPN